VIHKSVELTAPGHVSARRAAGDRFIFGAPSVSTPTDVGALLTAFGAAGLEAVLADDIRRELWGKLLGNAALNPLSALTGADMRTIIGFPPTATLVLEIMREVAAVAAAHGIVLTQTPEERLERTRNVGPARTSMLQDVSRNRPLEVDGILGSLLELADLTGVPTPRLQTLYAATSLLSACLGATHRAP
jgi:2-dehydropantoate 2-reductase